MARARRSAGSQRVIFWFNGGPGCSSFDGSLMEVGPFRVVPKAQTTSGQAEVKFVEGGWEEYATMVFIDQPPGVGLSFIPSGNHLTDLHQASAHLIEFMRNFYTVFPDLLGQEVSPRAVARLTARPISLENHLQGNTFPTLPTPFSRRTSLCRPTTRARCTSRESPSATAGLTP